MCVCVHTRARVCVLTDNDFTVILLGEFVGSTHFRVTHTPHNKHDQSWPCSRCLLFQILRFAVYCRVLQCVTVCCSVLRCCISVLQCVAV